MRRRVGTQGSPPLQHYTKNTSFLDGSVNWYNCLRYCKPKKDGGGGRDEIPGRLINQIDKFPKKVHHFIVVQIITTFLNERYIKNQ